MRIVQKNNIFEEVAHVKNLFCNYDFNLRIQIFSPDSGKSAHSTLYCKDMETEVGKEPNSKMNFYILEKAPTMKEVSFLKKTENS